MNQLGKVIGIIFLGIIVNIAIHQLAPENGGMISIMLFGLSGAMVGWLLHKFVIKRGTDY